MGCIAWICGRENELLQVRNICEQELFCLFGRINQIPQVHVDMNVMNIANPPDQAHR